jgi:hypothetical protein
MDGEFYAYLERKRAEYLQSIELFETGRIATGERRDGGDYVDTTAESLARCKRNVAEIERILAQR